MITKLHGDSNYIFFYNYGHYKLPTINKGQFDMVGTLVKYMVHLWTQKHNFLTTHSFKSFFMGDSDCLHSIIFEANNLETLHLKGFGPVNKPGLLQADD